MKKCIAKAFLIILGLSTIVNAAEPDVTGLVPAIYYDFDTQPDANKINDTNKGSATGFAFTHEGNKQYLNGKSEDSYALDTSRFTPYVTGIKTTGIGNPITLSAVMNLGTNPNGITLNVRSGAGDLVISRGDEPGLLVIGYGAERQVSSNFLKANVENGDSEYFHLALVFDDNGTVFYINGKYVAETTDFTMWKSNSEITAMQFGSHLNSLQGSEKRYGGCIDDLRIYGAALTFDQIIRISKDFNFLTSDDDLYIKIKDIPTVKGNEILVNYSLSLANEQKTAIVGLVYDTNEDFSNAQTNILKSAASSGTYNAVIGNLEFSTKYFCKIFAENGVCVSESNIFQIQTDYKINIDNFLRFVDINVTGYQGTSILTNFPILVQLTENNPIGFSYDDCLSGGIDLCFVDEEGIVIPHEVEQWNPEGVSYIWVRVSELKPGTTALKMYYKAISIDGVLKLNSEKVWSEYATVFHGTDSIVDATGNAAEVNPKGVVVEAGNGVVAGYMNKASQSTVGVQFSNPLTTSAISKSDEVSVSGWFKRVGSSHTRILISSIKNWGESGFIALCEKGSYLSVAMAGTHHGASGKGALDLNEWEHIAFSYAGDDLISYFNGEKIYENLDAKPLVESSSKYWAFGSFAEKTDDSFDGEMDELRIHKRVASEDWLLAEYASVVSPTTFVSYEDVVGLDSQLPVLRNTTAERNSDGSIIISTEVSINMPTEAYCEIAGNVYEMTTDSAVLPAIFSVEITDIPEGTYIADVVVKNGDLSVSAKSNIFYFGNLKIDVISEPDEGAYTSGLIRISREESEFLPELPFDISLSGLGANAVKNEKQNSYIIPEGETFIDVPIEITYSDEVVEDAEIIATVSGNTISGVSSKVFTVYNAKIDVFTRYVSTTGNDGNDGSSLEKSMLTISYAVESLIPFSMDKTCTVYVEPGLYKISKPIYVTNAIHILGMGETAVDVVVSNLYDTSNANQHYRCFYIDNADSVVANLTMVNGEAYNRHGGNFIICSSGGMVSNCVVTAGNTRDNGVAAGGYLEAGLVTHTIFRNNKSNSGTAHWGGVWSGCFEMQGTARAENCLFEENNQYKPVVLIELGGSSIMRNCTIVNNSLSATNEYCKVFSPLKVDSGARAENVVIAGVTNTIDGAACLPSGTLANFINGAVDGDITDLGFPENTIVGTATEFFKNYAAKDYRPNENGPLVGKGVNYSPMAALDLAGVTRLVGSRIDIGCYEAPPFGTILIVK